MPIAPRQEASLLGSQFVSETNIVAEGQQSHGLFSKDGKIGKHFATQEGGEEQGGESKTGGSKRIDRSEMYGGYGA